MSRQPDVIPIGNGTEELKMKQRAQLLPLESNDYNWAILAIPEECTANFRDYLLKDLAEPGFAKQYLEVSLDNYQKDGDINMLAHAIRNVVEAQGGMEKLAIQTNGNFQDIYDALDSKNLPQLNRLLDILSFYTDATVL